MGSACTQQCKQSNTDIFEIKFNQQLDENNGEKDLNSYQNQNCNHLNQSFEVNENQELNQIENHVKIKIKADQDLFFTQSTYSAINHTNSLNKNNQIVESPEEPSQFKIQFDLKNQQEKLQTQKVCEESPPLELQRKISQETSDRKINKSLTKTNNQKSQNQENNEEYTNKLNNDDENEKVTAPSNSAQKSILSKYWYDFTYYEGEQENGQAQGKGKIIYSNGDIYEGEWQQNMAHGFGKYIRQCGAYYIGQWQFDKQDGKGIEVWPDGSKYEGCYKEGIKHGKGKYYNREGGVYKGVYQGDFDNGDMHGFGIFVWANGKQYEGQWFRNKMIGKGKMAWPDGKIYQGDFENDMRHGFGCLEYKDGRKYIGQWQNGLQHGTGQFINQNQGKIIGFWEYGKLVKQEIRHHQEQKDFQQSQTKIDYDDNNNQENDFETFKQL